MAELPGYPTAIQKGGTSTAMSNEPTTKVTANTVYQVTDTAKRVADPTVDPTVEVDADGGGGGGYVTAAPATYTWDPYTGTVTFLSDQGSSALVRVSGNYIPLLTVASARASGIKIERDALDSTKFSSSSWRTYLYGLLAAGGTLDLLEDGLTDHDPGGGTQQFLTDFLAGTLALLTIQPGGAGSKLRTWAILTSADGDNEIAGLVTTKLAWRAAGRGNAPSMSWAA